MAATRATFGVETRRLAARLEDARRRGLPIAPPPELTLLSLAEAYDVQDALLAERERAGLVPSGWKLGLTSAVKQRIMGIAEPVFGRTFAQGALENNGPLARPAFIAPRTEPELAFSLARPLEPDDDAEQMLAAVAWVAPALEITDSRYVPGRRTAVELIADDTSAAAYVIGPRTPLDRAPQLGAIATLLIRNGVVLAAGSTADVLGTPAAALPLLARHLRERGLRTAAGDIVLSGAITDAVPLEAGDRFEARLTGLGTAAFTVV